MRHSFMSLISFAALALILSPASQASSGDQFKLLAHNVFLLPSTIKPGWGQQQRAALIAQAGYIQGQDAVILNELFDNPASAILLDGLRSQYPFQTPVLGRTRSGWDATLGAYSDTTPEDGGVAIVSRWPIEQRIQYVYSQGCGADYLSNKGFVYVRLNRNGQAVHIIGTHAQAADTGCPDGKGTAVRASQFEELRNFIAAKGIALDQLVFIGGDFNVIKDSSEYSDMLERLQVNAPNSYAGSDTTFDTKRNGIANYQYPNHAPEYLDYIFLSRHHRQLPFWHNQALDTPAPRWTVSMAGATWQFQDYSDHSPVAGFTWADNGTPTRASKPQQNLYGEVVLQSTSTGKTLRAGSSKANDWVKVNGTGLEPESRFSLRNWYYPESFCIRSGDYVEVESRRHPGYWLNWWLGGGGGNYAYYMKANDASNQLRVELVNGNGCLKDGDSVRFLDRDTLRGSDYYLQNWASGSWKEHLYLWSSSQAGAEQFRVQFKRAPHYPDWSSKLRY
jgi:sphingomyelin phosphodiesterase